MNTQLYRIHMEPEPEGGFTVTVPTLPGCITWGRDYSHALEMAQECISGFLKFLAKEGETIPAPDRIDEPVDTFVQIKTTVAA